MSRKVARFKLPSWYEGLTTDPVYWRNLGYRVVVEGEELSLQGVDLPPLWRWFEPADDTLPALRVARFGCARCAKPAPVAMSAIVRDDRGAGEPVAVVTYQQQHRYGASREVVMCRAVLHVPAPGADCRHGPLIAHLDDEPVTTFCRGCGENPIAWATVVETIRGAGGWAVTEGDLRPLRRRMVSLR